MDGNYSKGSTHVSGSMVCVRQKNVAMQMQVGGSGQVRNARLNGFWDRARRLSRMRVEQGETFAGRIRSRPGRRPSPRSRGRAHAAGTLASDGVKSKEEAKLRVDGVVVACGRLEPEHAECGLRVGRFACCAPGGAKPAVANNTLCTSNNVPPRPVVRVHLAWLVALWNTSSSRGLCLHFQTL